MKINKNRLISFFIIIFTVFILIWIVNPFKDNIEDRVYVKGKIVYIRCQTISNGARSLIKVNYKNKIYNLRITRGQCRKLNKEDIVEFVYLIKKDKILLEK